MTYTTQQLQAMKDSEINVALELKLNKGAEFVGNHYVETGDGIYPNVIKHKNWPNYRECTDYCNNPSDIMPLAFERGISLIYHADNEIWTSYDLLESWKYRNSFSDKSPYRAAACIILLMKV